MRHLSVGSTRVLSIVAQLLSIAQVAHSVCADHQSARFYTATHCSRTPSMMAELHLHLYNKIVLAAC